MPQVPSTRWCPTPEQLMILEEMYRTGVRTPNASQIQQITTHLSYYGKIEGKNVFYWFQNHKARERHKLRRRLTKQQQQQQQSTQPFSQHPSNFNNLEDASLPLTDASSQLLYGHQMNPQFLQQGGGFQEPRSQVMDLLRRLETGGAQEEASSSSSTDTLLRRGCEWMMMMDPSFAEPPSGAKPPKTLELFPTTSSGLKDECSISRSSSCSASTN